MKGVHGNFYAEHIGYIYNTTDLGIKFLRSNHVIIYVFDDTRFEDVDNIIRHYFEIKQERNNDADWIKFEKFDPSIFLFYILDEDKERYLCLYTPAEYAKAKLICMDNDYSKLINYKNYVNYKNIIT